jgi:hypothetical protein
MGWVVKRWRMEGLERVLSQESLAAAHARRTAAERDARRARRAADRTAAEAAADLAALERLGTELRAMVRRRRAADAGGAAWERATPAVGGPAALLRAAEFVARGAAGGAGGAGGAGLPAACSASRDGGSSARLTLTATVVDARVPGAGASIPVADARLPGLGASRPGLDGESPAPAPSTVFVDARPQAPAPSARTVGPAPADRSGAATVPPPARRSGRASMRSSALGELFRATTMR